MSDYRKTNPHIDELVATLHRLKINTARLELRLEFIQRNYHAATSLDYVRGWHNAIFYQCADARGKENSDDFALVATATVGDMADAFDVIKHEGGWVRKVFTAGCILFDRVTSVKKGFGVDVKIEPPELPANVVRLRSPNTKQLT